MLYYTLPHLPFVDCKPAKCKLQIPVEEIDKIAIVFLTVSMEKLSKSEEPEFWKSIGKS